MYELSAEAARSAACEETCPSIRLAIEVFGVNKQPQMSRELEQIIHALGRFGKNVSVNFPAETTTRF